MTKDPPPISREPPYLAVLFGCDIVSRSDECQKPKFFLF